MIAITGLAAAVPISEMKAEVYQKGGSKLPYRWVKTPGEDDPVLILFLHGAGERGDDNKAQLKHGVPELLAWLEKEKKAAVVVAPQCQRGVWWTNFGGDFRSPEGITLKDKPSTMMALVLEVTGQMIKNEKVDSKRVYVTGLSMGGFGSFAAVARRPDLFAAAIPICGGGDPKTAEKMKKVPFQIYHGDADKVVPQMASEVMVKALRKAGAKVDFESYPGVGHNSWTKTYRNPKVWEWLFTQKRD